MGNQTSAESQNKNTKNEIDNYENQYSDVRKHISDDEIEQNIRNLFANNKLSPYSELSFMETLGLNKTDSELDPIPQKDNKTNVFLKQVKDTKENDLAFTGTSVVNTEQQKEMNMIGGVNTSDINEMLKDSSDDNVFDLDKIIGESESAIDSETSAFETLLQKGGAGDVFLTTSDQHTNSSSEFDTTELNIENFMKTKQSGGKRRAYETSDENTSYNTEDINVLNLDSTSEIFPRNLNRRTGVKYDQ